MSQALSPDEIAQGQKSAARFLRMPPETAARIIADGLERRAPRVIVGNDAKVLSWVERLFPVDHAGLLDRLMPARR